MDIKYLQLLSKEYPNIESASTEIINLGAINCLPKATEYFFSDLHGEDEGFIYLLRSASGVIKSKIDLIFKQTLSEDDREQLEYLIYYPDEYLSKFHLPNIKLVEWQKLTIYRLIKVCKSVSTKYTRSKVRKQMPAKFAYIFDELLHADSDVDKERYYNEIINSIVEIEIANDFIISICELIRNLCVDKLHIIGDIFDRGPRPDIIIKELMHSFYVDIQWGNHDISWMGAAAGNRALMANVIRIAISYNNFDLLEDAYNINLRPLALFAAEVYKDDPCDIFMPHMIDENKYSIVDPMLAAKMHKAIAIIQFKLEGQLIEHHPEYEMDGNIYLKNINLDDGTIKLDSKIYNLIDKSFPTLNKENPLELTDGEKELMNVIAYSFAHSELLHTQINFMYQKGSMYKVYNNNLMYHGCILLDENGEFDSLTIDGKKSHGKKLMDYIDQKVNEAYFLEKGSRRQKNALDFMWYLWCGKKSPLFGKSKLSTFERYFIKEKETHEEIYNPYYKYSKNEETCIKILEEFGLKVENAHIINGHVPVKQKQGDSPIRANKKLFVIDGGIAKSVQSKTGIAGYTLIYNSQTLSLAEHKCGFKNIAGKTVRESPNVIIVERLKQRVTVGDTDNGIEISERIKELKELVKAYRKGIVRESSKYSNSRKH